MKIAILQYTKNFLVILIGGQLTDPSAFLRIH